MTEPSTIRTASPEDAVAIADVHVTAWQWAYRGSLPPEKLATIDLTARAAMWQQVLGGEFPDSDVWVAERDRRVIGFIASGPSRDDDASEDDGEIYAIYLRESDAGQGIGRALLTTAIDALRERGAATVTLWVLASNDRARHFYERAGFGLDGGEKAAPWEGHELHEVRYRLAT